MVKNTKLLPLRSKDHYLNESKVFCMFPWIHLNVTPKGDIYPCCSNNYTTPIGNTRNTSLETAFNSEDMKQLRLQMLDNKPSKICEFCYKHEEASPFSFRQYSKEQFSKYFEDVVPLTQSDGTVDDFKMRYLDIRFSNICNFKCRTCGSEFSSQWAQEAKNSYDPNHPVIIHADPDGNLLNEVLNHLDHVDLAYFAGGEPLITEEHYIILEEMIRKGRTDIILRYNTNASNLKYKSYDIAQLWKHFKKVELSCSIDHYGDRAEWLRNGTDWGKLEENLIYLRQLDVVQFQINTVFSIFNYPTMPEFYSYMIEKNLLKSNDWYNTLYLAVHPSYYCGKSLPKMLKAEASEKSKSWIAKNQKIAPCMTNLLNDAVQFADIDNTWKANKEIFLQHTLSIDKIRGENFFKIFPELNTLETLDE